MNPERLREGPEADKLRSPMRTALAVLLMSFLSATGAHCVPTLEAPPGWKDISNSVKIQGAVIALKGPETSSFVVKRVSSAALENPAMVRGYLNDVLAGMRDASKKDYRANGRVETRVFRSGLTAQLLRATLNGDERLVLAVFSAEGVAHVAVLMSAAPEAMLPSLLGAVQFEQIPGAIQESGTARSSDRTPSGSWGNGTHD